VVPVTAAAGGAAAGGECRARFCPLLRRGFSPGGKREPELEPTRKRRRGPAVWRGSAWALEGYGRAAAKGVFGEKGFPCSLTSLVEGCACGAFSKL